MIDEQHVNAQVPIVVLGAGPAGIGAGLALGERGLVLDAGADPGGQCQTVEFEGAVFDRGGHSFHTPHAEVRELIFGALEMHEQPRRANCFCCGAMIPYPFQGHYRQLLDADLVGECDRGLESAKGGRDASNFEEYLIGKFGPGIARHFLVPYNQKLWGRDLRRLAVDWTGERVADADLSQKGVGIRFSPFIHTKNESRPQGEKRSPTPLTGSPLGRRQPLGKDSSVAYPARGGFGEIMRALARCLPRLRLQQRIVRIDPRRRQLVTADGAVLAWSRIVSTLALDKLLTLMPDVPLCIGRLAAGLEALALDLVLVVVNHPVDTPIQRVYCAGAEIPAHKVVVNHNSSPYLRSLPRHGILAEVSSRTGTVRPAGELERQVVNGLVTLGLIQSPAEVQATRLVHVPRAYPVPTLDREERVRALTAWLEERGICPVGRFGQWAYINSDEALRRGLELGKRLLHEDRRHCLRAG
jgi:protoporphyrinogen oxidase